MKSAQLESLVSINRITPGRRANAARQVKVELLALGLDALAAICDAIINAERTLIALMREFRNAQVTFSEATWTPEIIAQDQLLDRLLSELRDVLVALGKRTGTPRGDAASSLYDVSFASGLAWYTQAPIDEENERVGELVERLARESAKLEKATVDELFAEVVAAHTLYNTLITTFRKGERTSYDAIKGTDLANQRGLLALVSRIITYTLDLPEGDQLSVRQRLLGPILQKDHEVSELIRQRLRIRDVDPDSGVPEAEG